MPRRDEWKAIFVGLWMIAVLALGYKYVTKPAPVAQIPDTIKVEYQHKTTSDYMYEELAKDRAKNSLQYKSNFFEDFE